MTETTSTQTALYHATSFVDQFEYRGGIYDIVRVSWFAVSRTSEPDYAALISGDTSDPYAREFISELFTADEADQLAAYLRDVHGTAVERKPEPMPVETSDGFFVMPVSAVASGGWGSGRCELWSEDGYSLPFKVEGYFNIAEQEDPLSRLVKQRCSHRCEHHGDAPWADVVPPMPGAEADPDYDKVPGATGEPDLWALPKRERSDHEKRDRLAQETAEYIVSAGLGSSPGAIGGPAPTGIPEIKATLLSGHCWISWMDDRVIAAMRALHGPGTFGDD